MSAQDQPLDQFLRRLSNQARISVVLQEGLGGEMVSIDVWDQPIDTVLTHVAKSLGTDVQKSGDDLYYIGKLQRHDRAVMVRHSRRLNARDLRQAVESLTSDVGQVTALADGLLIVADRVEVLGRLHQLLTEIESQPTPAWVVQLFITSVTKAGAEDLGLNLIPAAEVAATFATASSGFPSPGLTYQLNGGLDALLSATKDASNVRLVAQPMLYLVDGETARFTRGERVPIARTTITSDGNLSTQSTDVEYQQTGFELEVSLREHARQLALVNVDLQQSRITGERGGFPRIATEHYSTAAPVRSGGVYLIGSMVRDQRHHRKLSGLDFGRRETDDHTELLIWCRATRINALVGASIERSHPLVPEPQKGLK